MFWKRLLYYLNPLTLFRKPTEAERKNFNLRAMHGINRISILVFMVALVIVLVKIFRNASAGN